MGADRRIDGDGEPDLSVEQRRALGRIQLIGVIVILCATTLAGFVRTWQVLVGSFGVMVLVVLLLGWIAARVQRRPFRELVREANRGVLHDFQEQRAEWSHRLGHRD